MAAEVYPTFLAGQRLTATLLSAGQINTIRKTANEDVTSSITPQNDDELIVPVAANATYEIEFVIFAQSADAAADLLTAWSVPSGATGLKAVLGPTSTAAAFTSNANTAATLKGRNFATNVAYQLDTDGTLIIEKAAVVTSSTAGNVTFQWSQNTSSATATTVLSRSYVTYRRAG